MAARPKRKATDPKRRLPRQERALASVEAILTAATQILAAQGRAGLTTNHIAERAGVSIGTLYQYFADKEAIVIAIARRFLAEDRAAVLAEIGAAAQAGGEIDRAGIREGIRRYNVRPKVRRIVMETLLAMGRLEEVGGPVRDIGFALANLDSGSAPRSADWNVRLYVGINAIEGVIRSAAYEGSPYFGTVEFEDTLVKLARALIPELAGPGAIPARA